MKLSEYLEAKGLNQRDFATLIDEPEATISRIVNGKRLPTFKLFRKIAFATENVVTMNDYPDHPSFDDGEP